LLSAINPVDKLFITSFVERFLDLRTNIFYTHEESMFALSTKGPGDVTDFSGFP